MDAGVAKGADKPEANFEPRIMRGDDRMINPPEAYKTLEGPASGDKFEEAPIIDVVSVFMREALKRPSDVGVEQIAF